MYCLTNAVSPIKNEIQETDYGYSLQTISQRETACVARSDCDEYPDILSCPRVMIRQGQIKALLHEANCRVNRSVACRIGSFFRLVDLRQSAREKIDTVRFLIDRLDTTKPEEILMVLKALNAQRNEDEFEPKTHSYRTLVNMIRPYQSRHLPWLSPVIDAIHTLESEMSANSNEVTY